MDVSTRSRTISGLMWMLPLLAVTVACESQTSPSTSDSRETAATSSRPSAETTANSDSAVWRFAPDQSLQPSSTMFTALVSRVDCNSGVTGHVLAPEIHLSESRVVVTFSVAPSPPGGGRCQSNDQVPYQVQLSEPLEGRPLVDGRCLNDAEGEYASFCSPDATRFRPRFHR